MQTGMKILSPELSAIEGCSHGFFTRIGGTSPAPFDRLNTGYVTGDAPPRVDENLARVRFQIGVKPGALYAVSQVHKNNVVRIDEESVAETVSAVEADALYSRRADVALGIRTADCVPVLFSARDGSAVAAAHAGWRGAVAGILEATVAEFVADNIAPRDVVAVIGPCISQSHFEVGAEVVEQAAQHCDIAGLVDYDRGPKPYFDLRGYVARRLEIAGVGAVAHVAGCTYADKEQFFSYRRDEGRTGRQMSVIARCAPPKIEPEMFA